MYTYDPVGNYERVRVSCAGSGESLIQPLLDNQLERQHQNAPKPPTLHIDLELDDARLGRVPPEEVRELMMILSAFNLNLEITAPECAFAGFNFTLKWSLLMLIPPGASSAPRTARDFSGCCQAQHIVNFGLRGHLTPWGAG